MELFTIDPNLSNRRLSIIEHFQSFIWTDRYSAFGDVTIVAEPSTEMFTRLVPGALVGFDESDRIMMIKSAFREETKEHEKQLTVKGISLEAKFLDRAARSTLTAGPWKITGTVGAMLRNVVQQICVSGTGISANDVIPHLTATDLTGLVGTKRFTIKELNVYDYLKNACDAYGLGFRIRVKPGDPAWYFEVYKGTDRSGLNGVAFSEELDNLSEPKYLVSHEAYKNIAYVAAPHGTRIVYATGASSATAGMARNVLLVDASDIDTAAGSDLQDELLERGQQALAEHRKQTIFDGRANPDGMFRYGRDYFLGDKVVFLGDDKQRQVVTVTEHIWSADSNGATSYPTLSNGLGV